MLSTYYWRRLDRDGLEMLSLARGETGFEGRSMLIDAGPAPFGMSLVWRLGPDWRSQSLMIRRRDDAGEQHLHVRRHKEGWLVNGVERPDLAGCTEIDVSATPFCNSLALRALAGQGGELLALYVDAADLGVQPSRQRYEPVADRVWRYIDLGAAAGFEADIRVDEDLIVEDYDGLFSRL